MKKLNHDQITEIATKISDLFEEYDLTQQNAMCMLVSLLLKTTLDSGMSPTDFNSLMEFSTLTYLDDYIKREVD